jgi:hypothetical protein
MKIMTPLSIVWTAFHFLPLRLHMYKVFGGSGYLSRRFWDRGVQTWPNLHKIPQDMQIRSNLDPKISKVVWDNPQYNHLL